MTQHDNNFELNFLNKNKINYLYFRLEEIENPLNTNDDRLTQVFKNDEVVIYRYDKK